MKYFDSLLMTGKGSTSTLLSEMLRSAGYQVGLYTSPHLHHISERISTSKSPMCSEDFNALVRDHEKIILECQNEEQGALTHFEVLTGLAFRWGQ